MCASQEHPAQHGLGRRFFLFAWLGYVAVCVQCHIAALKSCIYIDGATCMSMLLALKRAGEWRIAEAALFCALSIPPFQELAQELVEPTAETHKEPLAQTMHALCLRRASHPPWIRSEGARSPPAIRVPPNPPCCECGCSVCSSGNLAQLRPLPQAPRALFYHSGSLNLSEVEQGRSAISSLLVAWPCCRYSGMLCACHKVFPHRTLHGHSVMSGRTQSLSWSSLPSSACAGPWCLR